VTQNVDGLHQEAGSRGTLDLHGRLDSVACLACGARLLRKAFQSELMQANPDFAARTAATAPDGDADLAGVDFARFRVPTCRACGGILKPAVVFFGESVPRALVLEAFHRLAESDALLVIGSSLMVYSGYRFCRRARRDGKPVAAINLGRTRGEHELDFRIPEDCGSILERLADRVAGC